MVPTGCTRIVRSLCSTYCSRVHTLPWNNNVRRVHIYSLVRPVLVCTYVPSTHAACFHVHLRLLRDTLRRVERERDGRRVGRGVQPASQTAQGIPGIPGIEVLARLARQVSRAGWLADRSAPVSGGMGWVLVGRKCWHLLATCWESGTQRAGLACRSIAWARHVPGAPGHAVE